MNTFNEKDSLLLINQMITQARNNFQKGSGTPIIFWGYLISTLAVCNYMLLYFSALAQWSFCVWVLTIPAIFIDLLMQKKRQNQIKVKTHLDAIVSTTWMAFFIAVVLLQIVFWVPAYRYKYYELFQIITPVIMLMVGMGLFIMAKVCKFNALRYGAMAFWLGAIICGFVGNAQFLILAVAMLIGFVVPGHLINKKAENNVS